MTQTEVAPHAITAAHGGLPTEPAAPAPSPAPALEGRRGLWLVGVFGGLILVANAWFAWSLPATGSRRGRAGAFLVHHSRVWGWMFDHASPPVSPNRLAATLVGVTVVFFAAWLGVVMFTWQRTDAAAVRLVVGLAVMATAISVFALPNQTSDIYDYALFGRVVAEHGGEAYHDFPDQYPADPVYPYSSHQYTGQRDNKLPAWTATAIVVAKVSGDRPVENLLAFRLLLGSATVATTVLVAWTLRRLAPGAAAGGAAAFGLNPITIVYGTSKTDALMALLVVAGVALAVAGRRYIATAAVALSVLVKLITAPVLVLVVGVPLPSRRARRASESTLTDLFRSIGLRALAAAGVAAVAYSPYRRPFDLAREQVVGTDHGSVMQSAHPIAVAGFVLALVLVAASTWHLRDASDHLQIKAFIDRSAIFLVVFALFLTRPGLPWYLLSALAMVALARSVPMLGVLAVLSGTSFLMGWWDSIGTRQYPLPPLAVDRPLTYLALASVAVLAGTAWWLRTHHQLRRQSTP